MSTTATSGFALLSRFERGECTYAGERYCADAGDGWSGYWPHEAWFCGGCGEIWRREVLDYRFAYRSRISGAWAIRVQYCPPCGEGEIRRQFAEIMEEYA